jgi:hypothetical protein
MAWPLTLISLVRKAGISQPPYDNLYKEPE